MRQVFKNFILKMVLVKNGKHLLRRTDLVYSAMNPKTSERPVAWRQKLDLFWGVASNIPAFKEQTPRSALRSHHSRSDRPVE